MRAEPRSGGPRTSRRGETQTSADFEGFVSEVAGLDEVVVESLPPPLPLESFEVLESLDSEEEAEPLLDAVEDRESVMYHPLPLKTMPTG
jgi:hypothetical protein